jgi:hypothetical protein
MKFWKRTNFGNLITRIGEVAIVVINQSTSLKLSGQLIEFRSQSDREEWLYG